MPELHTITEVTFSDRLAGENTFFKCLRSLKVAALCNWHLRVKNLGDEWVNYHPNKAQILDQVMWKIQNALVPIEQMRKNIEEFKAEWGGKAAAFMESVESEVHRFCAALTHRYLLLFQTGNSVSESANSAVDAFLNENKPHSELVQTLLQYDTEQNNRERRDLVAKNANAASSSIERGVPPSYQAMSG